jgi:hypothetical protein
MFYIQNVKHLWSHDANFRLHYFITNILLAGGACDSIPAWLLKFNAYHIYCSAHIWLIVFQFLPHPSDSVCLAHLTVCFKLHTSMTLKCAPLLTLLCRSRLSQYVDRPRQPDLPTASSFYHSGKESFKNSTRILGQNEILCYIKLKMTVQSPKSMTLTLLYQDCAQKFNVFRD